MYKVTVLMSTYNGEKYIKQQIDSILNQIEVDVELLIRDDGSSDSTVRIISEYSEKYDNVNYYIGKNIKPAKSFIELMNKKIDSEYFALSDQDDVWDEDKLISAINLINTIELGKPIMYFSNLRIVDQNNNFYRNAHIMPRRPQKYAALTENLVTGCTVVYNRKVSELLQGHVPMACSMHDTWLYLICIFMGEVIYDFNPHINYRQHGNNVLGTYLEKKSFDLYVKRIKRLFNRKLQPRYNNALNFLEQYGELLSTEDKKKVEKIAHYKDSMKNRIKLLMDTEIGTGSISRDIRYRMLIIMGIF